MTVSVEMVVETVTITAEGMADTLYRRTVTDTATGDVVLRDIVRETTGIEEVYGGLIKTAELFLAASLQKGATVAVTSEMFKNTAPPKVTW